MEDLEKMQRRREYNAIASEYCYWLSCWQRTAQPFSGFPKKVK
jgi:hypothetical protein